MAVPIPIEVQKGSQMTVVPVRLSRKKIELQSRFLIILGAASQYNDYIRCTLFLLEGARSDFTPTVFDASAPDHVWCPRRCVFETLYLAAPKHFI